MGCVWQSRYCNRLQRPEICTVMNRYAGEGWTIRACTENMAVAQFSFYCDKNLKSLFGKEKGLFTSHVTVLHQGKPSQEPKAGVINHSSHYYSASFMDQSHWIGMALTADDWALLHKLPIKTMQKNHALKSDWWCPDINNVSRRQPRLAITASHTGKA